MELKVTRPPNGFAPTRAADATHDSGLPRLIEERAPGPFGLSALGVGALEDLVAATDLSLAAAEGMRGLILDELRQHASLTGFALPELQAPHRQLIRSFQLVVLADAFRRRASERVPLPPVTGSLDLDGLPDLLALAIPDADAASRLLKLCGGYVEIVTRNPPPEGADPAARIVGAAASFLELLRRAALSFARQSSMRPLVDALARRKVSVAGFAYEGLALRALSTRDAGLMPVRSTDIVGNTEYLQAGLRLARDVAGYDLELGRNPKRVNPVLFGLGRPGCGKTVTAHAIANDFLDFCAERDIPARFKVIQRTDWASSYQNASASNLVRIFREEVYGFDGVCGVYWPDIDTAFASRASGQLRQEEKQNLGAVFGVFDGTLMPRDGKWFMICDANTLHMDEATVSRIAQNPMTVHGPTLPEHYTRMMRDLQLADVAPYLELTDEDWLRVGSRCAELDLSGRNVDAISGNVRAHVQDFDYPDAYFSADAAGRAALIDTLCKRAHVDDILSFIDDWARFTRDAERDAEERRFEDEVSSLVRRLNASRVAGDLLSQHDDLA